MPLKKHSPGCNCCGDAGLIQMYRVGSTRRSGITVFSPSGDGITTPVYDSAGAPSYTVALTGISGLGADANAECVGSTTRPARIIVRLASGEFWTVSAVGTGPSLLFPSTCDLAGWGTDYIREMIYQPAWGVGMAAIDFGFGALEIATFDSAGDFIQGPFSIANITRIKNATYDPSGNLYEWSAVGSPPPDTVILRNQVFPPAYADGPSGSVGSMYHDGAKLFISASKATAASGTVIGFYEIVVGGSPMLAWAFSGMPNPLTAVTSRSYWSETKSRVEMEGDGIVHPQFRVRPDQPGNAIYQWTTGLVGTDPNFLVVP